MLLLSSGQINNEPQQLPLSELRNRQSQAIEIFRSSLSSLREYKLKQNRQANDRSDHGPYAIEHISDDHTAAIAGAGSSTISGRHLVPSNRDVICP
jgi:hypothetical protein